LLVRLFYFVCLLFFFFHTVIVCFDAH
jgi:hypothetical protein